MAETIRLRKSGANTNTIVVSDAAYGVIGWIEVVGADYNGYNLLGDLVINAADDAASAAAALESHFISVINEVDANSADGAEVFFKTSNGAFAGAVYYDAGQDAWRTVRANGTITGVYASRATAVFALANSVA